MLGCGTERRLSFVFFRRFASLTFLFGLILLGAATLARAQTETLIHSFVGRPTDTGAPEAGLTMDSAGNLYGPSGNFFEMVKSSTGYHEKLFYNDEQLAIGGTPNPFIMDSAGNLFGTSPNGVGGYSGAVFELIKSSNGFNENLLYQFPLNGNAGDEPRAGLAMDSAGDLFGTTSQGSPYDRGAVFEMVKTSEGYTEKTLLTFTGESDGGSPVGGVILDSAGNLYGLAGSGGANQQGIVYEMVKSGANYTEKVLYNFAAPDGAITYPVGNLTMDSVGNLFGVTANGGANQSGTVYELAKSSGGYTPTVLYNFTLDDRGAHEGVTMDSAGNLYGTTPGGRYGRVFELVKSSTGYTFRELWAFQGEPGDGYDPWGGLIIGPAGNLYGVTELGGTLQNGALFEVNPSAPRSGVTLSPSNVNFVTYLAGTTSPPQAARLTNYTSSSLGLSSVWISGTDASDFAVTLPDTGVNCSTSTSVAANGGTCNAVVTLTPSIVGTETATLNIADSAGTQTVNLMGTGYKPPDFTISTASGSPSSVTVKAGGTAEFSLALTSEYGFDQNVAVACFDVPSAIACSSNPSSVGVSPTAPATVTISVKTTAPALVAPREPDSHTMPPAALWLTSLGLVGLFMMGFAPGNRKRWLARLAPLAVVLLAVVIWASCGGGGGSSSSPASSPATPAGTYTLTVKGYASAGVIVHSVPLTLTVQ